MRANHQRDVVVSGVYKANSRCVRRLFSGGRREQSVAVRDAFGNPRLMVLAYVDSRRVSSLLINEESHGGGRCEYEKKQMSRRRVWGFLPEERQIIMRSRRTVRDVDNVFSMRKAQRRRHV